MKILIVASYNKGRFAPFITEQAEALHNRGNDISYFGVVGKGIMGYLRSLRSLQQTIRDTHPDIIHAHYGLSGLLACLQRRVPVVVTYHGSDINNANVLPFSRIAMRLAAWNIFVSKRTVRVARPPLHRYTLLPCGVNLTDEQLLPKAEARALVGWESNNKYVLFAGAFDNAVKNAPLALATVDFYNQQHNAHCRLLELKGYSRNEVNRLMCAADALLLTSHTEGSPQVIKEALACGCPVVSVNVGDLQERLHNLSGCYLSNTYTAEELASLLAQALSFQGRTEGRKRMVADGLDNRQVAKQLQSVYNRVLHL